MLLKRKKCPNCGAYYDPTLEKCPSCHKHNELYLNREISNQVVFLHPISQIAMFLIGFGFVGMILTTTIFAIIFGSLENNKILYNTVVLTVSYLAMIIALMAIVLLTRKEHFFSKYKRAIDYIYGIGYAFTLFFAAQILGSLVEIFYKASDNANQETAILIVKNYPIIAFFLLGFLGPICEELTYRVGLYSFFRRINKYLAIIVSTILFALVHFTFDAEDIINELWALPSYLLSGVILALAYEHRGPACSMTAHVLYNIAAFLLMLNMKVE